jgi:hypothetical protein
VEDLVKHSDYEGVEIAIDARGRFTATVDGEEISSETYENITKAITAKQRRVTRVQAAEIPVVALVRKAASRYAQSTTEEWVTGTFRGVNAHTGDVMFTVGGKKESYDGPWLFRPDDPAIPGIKDLITQRAAARKEWERLEEVVEAALRKHGIRPTGQRYGGDKQALAAETEEAVVKKLGKAAK